MYKRQSNSYSKAVSPDVTAQFVDSIVVGLDYRCGAAGEIQQTNANGEFTCKAGQTVFFSVGEVALGSFVVQGGTQVVTPKDIVEADTAGSKVEAIAVLLQTLDDDNNPDNGIHLDQDEIDAVNAIDRDLIPFPGLSAGGLQVGNFLGNANPMVVSTAEALTHLDASAKKLLAGVYRGSVSDDVGELPNSELVFLVNRDGEVQGFSFDEFNGVLFINDTRSSIQSDGSFSANNCVIEASALASVATGCIKLGADIVLTEGALSGNGLTASWDDGLLEGSAFATKLSSVDVLIDVVAYGEATNCGPVDYGLALGDELIGSSFLAETSGVICPGLAVGPTDRAILKSFNSETKIATFSLLIYIPSKATESDPGLYLADISVDYTETNYEVSGKWVNVTTNAVGDIVTGM